MAASNAWPTYVAAGPFLFFSGQMGRDALTGSFAGAYTEASDADLAKSAFEWVRDMEAPVGAQALAIYAKYRELLAREGSDLGHILRYHIYQRDKHFFSVFDRIRRSFESKPPASTAVGMGRFDATDTATLCIDSIVLRGTAEKSFGVRSVLPGAAKHVAAATFSHVVNAGPFLFLAGQIPIDASKPGSPLVRGYDDVPHEGRFLRVGRSHEDARNGPIAAQTWFTYDLIRQHLEAEGSALEHVLNVIVYLQDIRDFPTFHRVHERFFGSNAPALTVIEVQEVGHKGTLIEIEPTAILPGRGIEKKVVSPEGWRAPAQMSAAASAGGILYLSGIPGASAGDSGSAHGAQARSAISDLQHVLAASGASLASLVHLTVYIDDLTHFCEVEAALTDAFGSWRPALTLLEVPAPAPVRCARVSMTAIAWVGEGAPVAEY